MESFKRRYKTNDRIPLICCILIIVLVLFLSTGFAAFSTQLSISAMATIRVQADIRVTNVSAINGTNGASSNYEDYNVHNITSAVNLPNANSTITYHIEVTNIGNVEQGIYAIDEIYKNISTNTNSNLEIKSKTINLKESLCDDTNSSQCKLGSVTTFDITIGYKNNGYDGTNLTHLVQIDFDFRRMFDITYVGFSGNTSGLPNKMIDGDTKTVTFDNTTGIPTAVTVSGASGSYSSPTLTLSNITIQNLVDTIVVTRAYSVTYTGFTGNTSGLISTITATGGTITFNNTTGIPTNVVVNGASSSYSSPNLTLSSVTGNVTISNAYPITYTGFTNSTSGLPSAVPATGGTITFDSTSGIPTSVTVTGATGSYSSPTLTLTNVTGSVTITATFGGGGSGTPVEDDTTTTYDPDNIPPNSNVVYTAIDGAPQVTTDSNGNITSFELTDVSSTNPVVISSSEPLETGFIPFDGSSNWELNMKFKYTSEDNSNTSAAKIVTVLSCADWSTGSMTSGFNFKFYNFRNKSGNTYFYNNMLKYRPQLQIENNGTVTTRYDMFIPASAGANGIFMTSPMVYTLKITKNGNNMTFDLYNDSALTYNSSNTNNNPSVAPANSQATITWQDNGSNSDVDIKIGAYLSSSGVLSQQANIEVYSFSVEKTN